MIDRLRCRCCGIGAPDVGFTIEGDVLCDDCETKLAHQIGGGTWAAFLRERGADIEAREERIRANKAAFVRMVGETFKREGTR